MSGSDILILLSLETDVKVMIFINQGNAAAAGQG